MSDEADFIKTCLDNGRDQAPWGVFADWLDEQERPDAATMLRTHAPGYAALAEHLPHVWETVVKTMTRKKAYTWELLCRETGEAMACAAKAAGARGVPAVIQRLQMMSAADHRAEVERQQHLRVYRRPNREPPFLSPEEQLVSMEDIDG